MWKRILGLGVVASLFAGTLGAGSAMAAGNATLNVVHGIPGVTVNVCANGEEAIPDFEPGDVASGVVLPAGAYDFAIVASSDSCLDEAILQANDVLLESGKNYTAVANLDDEGTPNIKLFRNNVKPVDGVRLTVRHTAHAPAVNVWANGSPLVAGDEFTSGSSATAVVPKGIYAAWVSLPGEFEPVIGPEVWQLRRGFAYQVYAWGSGEAGYHLAVVKVEVGTA